MPKKLDTSFVQKIKFPLVHDQRGDLTFVEGGRQIPFSIARVYFLYNVPVDAERGGHAHKKLQQVLIAMSGSFRVRIDDGAEVKEFWLRDPGQGLFLTNMVWREIDCFSQGAVCMVLASEVYDESDYYRDYSEFLEASRLIK